MMNSGCQFIYTFQLKSIVLRQKSEFRNFNLFCKEDNSTRVFNAGYYASLVCQNHNSLWLSLRHNRFVNLIPLLSFVAKPFPAKSLADIQKFYEEFPYVKPSDFIRYIEQTTSVGDVTGSNNLRPFQTSRNSA
jgi:hypothetical protein